MNSKSYIAILLVTIFMVKFVAVDSRWLTVWYDGSDIALVKPPCKNEYPPKFSKDITTPQMGQSFVQVILLKGYCTSLFQPEMSTWEAPVLEPVSRISRNRSSIPSLPYLQSSCPPPRVL